MWLKMYNRSDIRNIKISAAHYDLSAPEEFWQTDDAILSGVCNGCGPECLTKDQRASLTEALGRYAAAYAIHDVEYEVHISSREIADKNMRSNMLRIWKKDFGFWRWLSIAGIFNRVIVIPTAYQAVRKYGQSAWYATKRRIKKHEKVYCSGTMCHNAGRMYPGRKTSRN